eukprot:GFYU01002153.1.p1 GENE.GFYU01002153.1~~GFYU01002153.1.p1  ORF type:complete len:208 (+),score=56.12 GFYU01002153.1:31-624(+)
MASNDTEVVCDGDVCKVVPKARAPGAAADVSARNSSGPSLGLPGTLIPQLNSLQDVDGKEVLMVDITTKLVLVYVSASWCPPCQHFSPRLDQFAKKHAEDLTVILLSLDKTEEKAEEYLSHYENFIMLPYAKRDTVQRVCEKIQVMGIPSLAVLDRVSGDIITTWGRSAVERNPDGCVEEWKKGGHGVSWFQYLKFW